VGRRDAGDRRQAGLRELRTPRRQRRQRQGRQDPEGRGLSVARATARLKAAGFKPVVGKRVKSRWKAGTVVGTVPGSRAIKGATVEMLVSKWRG
jgi:hypothetical protein